MKVGRQSFDVLLDDAAGAGTATDAGAAVAAGGSLDDAAYYRAEAQKAFKARDELKKQLREFESRVLSDEDRELFASLKEQQTKADEDRQKKAGEWEALKQQQRERHEQQQREHQKALADKDSQYGVLSDRFKNTVIKAEFGAAVDYFSGADNSKTILDVDLGMAALGKFVTVEDDETDPVGYRVIVKKPNGDTIFGADGNPAPFAEAIGELIKALPNRDRILRGSGKTGSGSSGGSNQSATAADLTELTRKARAGDQKAIAALRARRSASGGMVIGEAFSKPVKE